MSTIDGDQAGTPAGGPVNTRWAIALMDGLAAGGVRHAAVCPGSRSTPLALAAEHHPDVRTHVAIDERSGAFHALGMAKGSGCPAVVITTSGTAVANLLPACIEAHQSNTPLLLLTADRPPRLRDTGANQTIHQPGMFRAYVRHDADLPLPSQDRKVIDAAIEKAVDAATGWPPGPVHLNQPFDEPLAPGPADQELLEALSKRPARAGADDGPREAGPPRQAPQGATVDLPGPADTPDPSASGGPADPRRLLARMRGARGLVVCGPATPPATAEAALRLAQRRRVPVIADALSGIRFGDAPTIDGHDLLLGHPDIIDRLRPDWIVQTGHSPTSKVLRAFLAAHPEVWRLKLDASGRGWNDIPGDVLVTDADPVTLLDALGREADGDGGDREDPQPAHACAPTGLADGAASMGGHAGAPDSDDAGSGDDAGAPDAENVGSGGDADVPGADATVSGGDVDAAATADAGSGSAATWRDQWRDADRLADQQVQDALADEPDAEPCWVAAALDATDRLFVGNSLPVRDLERVGRNARRIAVHANRGASGIDGTLATAAGIAAAAGPTLAVIGDVAFQHDVGSLALMPPDLRLVVVRNGGGRIFHHVPVAEATDHFERLFLTPPAMDPLKACAAFGIDGVQVAPSGLADALQGGPQVIVLDVDGEHSVQVRSALETRVHAAIPGLVRTWPA